MEYQVVLELNKPQILPEIIQMKLTSIMLSEKKKKSKILKIHTLSSCSHKVKKLGKTHLCHEMTEQQLLWWVEEERRKKQFLERFKEEFWGIGNSMFLDLGKSYIDMLSLWKFNSYTLMCTFLFEYYTSMIF